MINRNEDIKEEESQLSPLHPPQEETHILTIPLTTPYNTKGTISLPSSQQYYSDENTSFVQSQENAESSDEELHHNQKKVTFQSSKTSEPQSNSTTSGTTGIGNSLSQYKSIINNDQSTEFAANVFGISHNDDLLQKNNRLEKATFFLLILLGIVAGLINGLILFINSELCQFQAWILNTYGNNYEIGFLYFLVSSCGFVFIAALLCKSFSPTAAGSGLPEFKALLAKTDVKRSDYMRFVSTTILITKVIGLIFSVGSCLSVGTEGPLVHVAACVAYLLLANIHEFESILDSPNLARQIFAASAAVGISSAFNAPVGGLLFSVEATTTFYLIANYWKSCVAAACGAAACYFFLSDADPLKLLYMHKATTTEFEKWELVIFFIIGVFLGYAATLFLYLHQQINILFRPYNRSHPIALAVAVALCTGILIYVSGSYGDSVGIISLVSDVVNDGNVTEMRRLDAEPIGGLFASFLVRNFLTLIATNIAVPAGIFMPVFLIGGLFGRFVGAIIAVADKSINISSYALVGAAAFSAGVTQTVSVAMIGVELTGNINLLLPLLIVSVTAAGISRMNGLSIYDQGILNKGLESFQLLLTETGGFKYALEVCQLPQSIFKHVRIIDLIKSLQSCKQRVFPVVDSVDREYEKIDVLLGSLTRIEIYSFLKDVFCEELKSEILSALLPLDTEEYLENASLISKRIENANKRELLKESLKKTLESTEVFTSNFLFDDTKISNVGEKSEAESGDIESDLNFKSKKRTPIIQVDTTQAWEILNEAAEKVMRAVNSDSSDNIASGKSVDELLLTSPELSAIVNNEVDILFESKLHLNKFTHSVSPYTPMEHVYVLFEMVKANAVFILGAGGELKGMITPQTLLEALRTKQRNDG